MSAHPCYAHPPVRTRTHPVRTRSHPVRTRSRIYLLFIAAANLGPGQGAAGLQPPYILSTLLQPVTFLNPLVLSDTSHTPLYFLNLHIHL